MCRHSKSVRMTKKEMRRKYTKGFSLIEMLVAMAIMAMSLTALYQATAGATRNVRVDEKYSYAYLLAESLMAEYAVVDINGTDEHGSTAGGFHWHVMAQPVIGDAPAVLKEDGLQAVQITVAWGEEDTQRQVRLDTVVAGREM